MNPLSPDLNDEDLKWSRNRLHCWIHRVLPFIQFPARNPLRHAVYRQLLARQSIPMEDWPQRIDHAALRTLLTLTKEELEWPNPHFHPDDPLRLVLQNGDYDFGVELLLHRIQASFGRTISVDSLQKLIDGNVSLLVFVDAVVL